MLAGLPRFGPGVAVARRLDTAESSLALVGKVGSVDEDEVAVNA